ncbi:MAG: FG-GAP-like repeat-containing protein [Planctomycetota bacterium]|nr:FG-GAP-like repeat-containing protein [Planctomycetota bacterium]
MLDATLADLNGDGLLDVIATLGFLGFNTPYAVAWLRNDGFMDPAREPAELARAGSERPLVFDVDQDGDLDLVTPTGGSLLWLQNEGGPTPAFSEQIAFRTGVSITSASAGDLDGDMDTDFVTTSFAAFTGQLRWHENVEVENLRTNSRHSRLEPAINAATSGDALIAEPEHFNLECAPLIDLAGKSLHLVSRGAISRPSASETILADGAVLEATHQAFITFDGLLRLPQNSTTMLIARGVALNGPLEAAPQSVLIASDDLLICGTASFIELPPENTENPAAFPFEVVAADFDGDGDIDLAFDDPLNFAVVILYSDGASTPAFTFEFVDTFPYEVTSIAASDIDGDGDVDLVAASQALKFGVKGGLFYLDNDGSPDPNYSITMIADDGANYFTIVPADFDDDGDVDIATASAIKKSSSPQIVWFENNGAETPSFTRYTLEAQSSAYLASDAADFDGDGDLDLLVAGVGLAWCEFRGGDAPEFVERPIDAGMEFAFPAFASDLNGDELDDVLVVSDRALMWYENSGGPLPGFSSHPIAPDARFTWARPGDLDLDGDLDIAAIFVDDQFGSAIGFCENSGLSNPTFGLKRTALRSDVSVLLPVDLDRDEDLDLVTLSDSFDNPWYQNVLRADLAFAEGSTIQVAGGLGLKNKSATLGSNSIFSANTDIILDENSILSGSGLARTPLLASSGEIAPSPTDALTIEGDYIQYLHFEDAVDDPDTGDLLINLTDGSQFSRLTITGAAQLAGGLRAVADPSFNPPVGDRFEVLTASTISGRFDVAFLPGLPGGKYLRVEYNNPDPSRGMTASVTLVVDTVAGRGADLDDPQNFTIEGLPSDAILTDLFGPDRTDPDGLLDLVLAIPASQNPSTSPGAVSVLINGGVVNGVWQGFSGGVLQVTVGPNPISLSAGDMDNDKDIDDDVLVAHRGDNTIAALINTVEMAQRTLAVQPSIPLPATPNDLLLRDFDLDGRLDTTIAARDASEQGRIITLLNSGGDGPAWTGFALAQDLAAGQNPLSLSAGDMDNDKDIDDDVAAGDADNASVLLFQNQGSAVGGWNGFAEIGSVSVGNAPLETRLEDLDLDGDLDIITADRNSGTISIARGLSDLNFTPATGLPVGQRPRSLALADLDLDGDSDIGVIVDAPDGASNDRILRVLRNDLDAPDGQLAFAPAEDVMTDSDPLLVLEGDVDNRAGEDFITVGEDTASRAHNRGAPVAGASTILAEPCPADFNADGVVNATDLASLLAAWGQQSSSSPADLVPDNLVNAPDLMTLLGAWGPCR